MLDATYQTKPIPVITAMTAPMDFTVLAASTVDMSSAMYQ